MADVIISLPEDDSPIIKLPGEVYPTLLPPTIQQTLDHLGELVDVQIAEPIDGQVLTYETATKKWKPRDISGIPPTTNVDGGEFF